MNKAVIGAVVAIVLIAGGATVLMSGKDDNKQRNSTETSAQQTSNPFTQNNDQSKTEVQTGEVRMNIQDFAFAQKKLKIKKGTKVTWTNQDSAKHDITPDTESPDFKASDLLAKGESYTFTFANIGTYTYHCSPHPYMKASIEVVE